MSGLFEEFGMPSSVMENVHKYGRTFVTVTQKYSDMVGPCKKTKPAFREWERRLNPGERLPRGRYFKGLRKKA
jgi:hypothetical protein